MSTALLEIDDAYDLIDSREGKGILRVGVIHVRVINTHPLLAILLGNIHGVRQPFKVLNLSDESNSQELFITSRHFGWNHLSFHRIGLNFFWRFKRCSAMVGETPCMWAWDHAKMSTNSCKSESRELTSSWTRCVPRLTCLGLAGPNM